MTLQKNKNNNCSPRFIRDQMLSMRSIPPWGGDVAQLLERRTVTPLKQVRFPGVARDLSPTVNIQCRLSFLCPYTPVCNRMHWHLCARKRSCCSPGQSSVDYGNTETPPSTVEWVERLCRRWLSPEEQPDFLMGESQMGQYSFKKNLYVVFFVCLSDDDTASALPMKCFWPCLHLLICCRCCRFDFCCSRCCIFAMIKLVVVLVSCCRVCSYCVPVCCCLLCGGKGCSVIEIPILLGICF